MNKEQWSIAISGSVLGTFLLSRGQRLLPVIVFVICLILLYLFRPGDNGGGGGWEDYDPAPVDPDPHGYEIFDQQISEILRKNLTGVS